MLFNVILCFPMLCSVRPSFVMLGMISCACRYRMLYLYYPFLISILMTNSLAWCFTREKPITKIGFHTIHPPQTSDWSTRISKASDWSKGGQFGSQNSLLNLNLSLKNSYHTGFWLFKLLIRQELDSQILLHLTQANNF